MNKLIITAALVASTVVPAHAISEAYRRQLQHDHKTMVSEANVPVNASMVKSIHVNKLGLILNVVPMALPTLMVARQPMMKIMQMRKLTVQA